MKTAKTFLRDNLSIEVPEGSVSGEWFAKNGLPMIVRCTCCDMTMVLFSAYVNEEGETFCASCAGMD